MMVRKGFRRALYAVVIAAVVLAGWRSWQLSHRAPQYELTQLTYKNIETTVHAIGMLQPWRYVNVGAQVSGQINTLHVQAGSQVKQGDLLVEIDPSVQQAVVDAGRASIYSLQAQLDEQQAAKKLAHLRWQRQQRLHQDGATFIDAVDSAEAEYAITNARIRALQAQVAEREASQRAEEAQLSYTRIYAPMDGTVVAVEAREGQTLNATYQTPNIMRIADLATMTVWADVSEADIRKIQVDTPVYFTTLDANEQAQQRLHSRVRQILPAPTNQSLSDESGTSSADKAVTYTVLFDIANPSTALLPQMTAQVSFVTASANEVLALPLALLHNDGEQASVLVQDADGSIVERQVQLGVRSRHEAEVVAGLSAEDLIVAKSTVPASGGSWLIW